MNNSKKEAKTTFVKVAVKDNGKSLMTCGSTHMCNESKK